MLQRLFKSQALAISSNSVSSLVKHVGLDQQSDDVGLVRLALWGTDSDKELLKRRAMALIAKKPNTGFHHKGMAYVPKPISGQIAAMYSGAASSYPGMGQDLFLRLPGLAQQVSEKFPGLAKEASWIYKNDEVENHAP